MTGAWSVGGKLWLLVFLFLFPCGLLWPSSPILIAGAEEKVVTYLPGFEGPLPFVLRTGYVVVDESNGVHLFYYFTPSERSPADDPILIWLSGGPTCSSFNGLVYQIGPLGFDLEGSMDRRVLPKLVYRQESWTKVANIIFLDSPVGAGFSYSTKQEYISSDTKAVNQIVIFIRKWFNEHPDYLSNPLYIGGDSYSGMIVPTVTSELAKGKQGASEAAALNLKGYLVGNPLTDGENIDIPSRIPFAHRIGLISDDMYEEYRKSCGEGNINQQRIECTNSLAAIDKCVKDINIQNILEPNECDYATNPELKSGILEVWQLQNYIYGISTKCKIEAEYGLSRIWANDDAVREALGIHKIYKVILK